MIRTSSAGHDVVDDHRQPGLQRDRAEMLEHRVVVGAEQIVHRRDLQRGDAEVPHQPAAPDRLAGRIDDDPGDHRHPPGRGLDRRGEQLARLRGIERVALAGAAAGREAMGTGADQPVDLPLDQLQLQLAIGAERGGHRRDDAAQLHLLTPCFSVHPRRP
jgi:hypothetical protein